jgi:hypothetical protein
MMMRIGGFERRACDDGSMSFLLHFSFFGMAFTLRYPLHTSVISLFPCFSYILVKVEQLAHVVGQSSYSQSQFKFLDIPLVLVSMISF